MYLRRSDLILPRTICLNRLASRSILRTTASKPPPRASGQHPKTPQIWIMPAQMRNTPRLGPSGPPTRKSKDLEGETGLKSDGRVRVEDGSAYSLSGF